MPLPTTRVTKTDGGTGVVRPSATGVAAIIAPSELGPVNAAQACLRTDVGLASFGGGKLLECAAYLMPVSGKPSLLVKGAASTAGAYGTIVQTGAGTSVPTGDGVSLPNDDFSVLITVKKPCTIGVTGGTYTYSLDGGKLTSPEIALGTAAFILIPNTGVKVDLAAGTLLAGQTIAFPTTGPANTNGDLVNALEALRVTRSPFECVLYEGPADATTVADLDTWITALALTGRFKFAICTARARHTDGSETEAQYKTFLQGLFAATASINVIVCADVGDVSSPIPNRATSAVTQPRAVGWAVAARCMKIPLGQDPAFGDPVSQFVISDATGAPNHHDEAFFPGLDDLRLATLRTFDGEEGTFITNAPIISTAGSDYVYAQHVRTINRACEIAYAITSKLLSIGVSKSPTVGPNGERYISEGAALRIEAACNGAIRTELAGQVDDIRFTLSRTDNIASNAGAKVGGAIASVALAYIKEFDITAGYVKSLPAQ